MPLPSIRSSTSSKVKKRPMTMNCGKIPNTQNSTAKFDDRKSKQPQEEDIKEPAVETSASTFMSFNISGATANSTDEEKIIREISYEKEIHRDFEVGEPPRFQHLTIDFTPIKGVDDDEELQQKCIDFWEFVNSEPRLTKIIAEPVKKKSYVIIDDKDNLENIDNRNLFICDRNIDIKALPALQWTQNLPMLNYLGKLSKKYCSEPPPSYKHTSKNSSESSASMLKVSKTSTWTMKHKKATKPKDASKSAARRSKENTRKVCADMDEFDRKHPRSFEPPVRNPTLITAKMQRFLPSLSCASLCASCDCVPPSTN